MSMMINDCWSDMDHEKILDSSSERLWRFVQQHGSIMEKNRTIENLTGLNQNQTRQLASMHLILSNEVQEFVEKIAPSILRRISKVSHHQTITERGQIKSNVNWTKTVLKQRTEMDSSLFVSVNRSPVFDLVENKVLLYCLSYIYQISQGLLNKGLELNDSASIEFSREEEKWMKTVKHILLNCQKLLKNPLFRNITELHGIDQQQIEKTRKVRGRQYFHLGEIANLIYIQKNKPLDFLHHALPKQLLRPLSRDTLYEIAVVFRILDVFKENGWEESRFSLIGEGQKVLSCLQRENSTINIYYQHIPGHFVKNSRYKELMKETHLSIHHRRPDIMLEWINEKEEKTYTIIEVKRSQNRGYLADGIYKVLGYLKDFEISMQTSSHSKGLLIGWKIRDLESPKDYKEVYTADWERIHLSINQMEVNMNAFLYSSS